ncbi:hypothetical protein [Lysobacter gummosus]
MIGGAGAGCDALHDGKRARIAVVNRGRFAAARPRRRIPRSAQRR